MELRNINELPMGGNSLIGVQGIQGIQGKDGKPFQLTATFDNWLLFIPAGTDLPEFYLCESTATTYEGYTVTDLAGDPVTATNLNGHLIAYNGVTDNVVDYGYFNSIPGTDGTNGTNGEKAWSPIFAVTVRNSGGKVLRLWQWLGGEGTRPLFSSTEMDDTYLQSTNPLYLGAAGLTSDIDAAVNIAAETNLTLPLGDTTGQFIYWNDTLGEWVLTNNLLTDDAKISIKGSTYTTKLTSLGITHTKNSDNKYTNVSFTTPTGNNELVIPNKSGTFATVQDIVDYFAANPSLKFVTFNDFGTTTTFDATASVGVFTVPAALNAKTITRIDFACTTNSVSNISMQLVKNGVNVGTAFILNTNTSTGNSVQTPIALTTGDTLFIDYTGSDLSVRGLSITLTIE